MVEHLFFKRFSQTSINVFKVSIDLEHFNWCTLVVSEVKVLKNEKNENSILLFYVSLKNKVTVFSCSSVTFWLRANLQPSPPFPYCHNWSTKYETNYICFLLLKARKKSIRRMEIPSFFTIKFRSFTEGPFFIESKINLFVLRVTLSVKEMLLAAASGKKSWNKGLGDVGHANKTKKKRNTGFFLVSSFKLT